MPAISTIPLGGKNSLQVTNLGFGTAPIGNVNTVSAADAEATIQYAYEQGIRLFDSAPLYGRGESELRIGRALRGVPRSSPARSSTAVQPARSAPRVRSRWRARAAACARSSRSPRRPTASSSAWCGASSRRC